MGICYHCGKEVDLPTRCPHCNLSYCEEHLPQRVHNCIALSKELTGIEPQPITTTIYYVEQEEDEEETWPRPRIIRAGKNIGLLGEGVTPRKVAVVAMTLAISLGSIFLLNQFPTEPDRPNAGPVFPFSKKTIALQEYTLSLINAERVKAEQTELILDKNSIAQRYAEEMLRTGVLKNNPELPGNMGENIMYFEGSDFNVTVVLEDLIYDMVCYDANYDWGNRDNILYGEYTMVSIGVAYDEGNLYLVQDFS